MKIHVNGEERELAGNLSVTGLLKVLGIRPVGIAVELNKEIVTKNTHETTMLKDGDFVEIVRMVGGG